MRNTTKILNGAMNLDDANEVFPSANHKEVRNGVFRGNSTMMKFQTIRGNQKITNPNLKTNDR